MPKRKKEDLYVELSSLDHVVDRSTRSTAEGLFAALDPEEAARWLEGFAKYREQKQIKKDDKVPRMLGRSADCYIDPRTNDLGPYVRCVLAIRLILKHFRHGVDWQDVDEYEEDGKQARTDLIKLLNVNDNLDPGTFDHIFLQGGQAWVRPGDYIHSEIIDLIVLKLQEYHPNRPKLTRSDFLEVLNVGIDESLSVRTFIRFEHWLENGIHPPSSDLSRLMCEKFISGDTTNFDRGDRFRQLVEVSGSLLTGDSNRPVINVFASSCSSGLRAFATSTLLRLIRSGEERGYVYLRLSRSSNDEEPPSPASVVRQLQRVFGLPVSSREEWAERPFDLNADLLEIRRALSTYQTVLVVDGIGSTTGPISALFETLRNSHWAEFLRVLIQPHEGTLRQGKWRAYPSRMLLLSSEPVVDLAPWILPAESRPLAPVAVGSEAKELLASPSLFDDELERIRLELHARRSSEALHMLYALEPEQQDALFEGRPSHELPDELDFALAMLHGTTALKNILDRHTLEGGRDVPSARRDLLQSWMTNMHGSPDGFAPLVAVLFIASCVNGMRVSTLRRCMRDWLSINRDDLTASQRQQLETFLEDIPVRGHAVTANELAEAYRHLLILSHDEDIEAVGPRQRRYELQTFPSDGDSPADPREDQILLDIRLEEFRELLFSELIHGSTGVLAGRKIWESMHFCLAEEALRQSVSQLRNLPTKERGSRYVSRRLIQAVFHGLLSHSYTGDAQGHRIKVRDFNLSVDPHERFRYLWIFIFRNCIENAPDWLLARGFGQSEVRFVLLVMFANPRVGVNLLGRLIVMPAETRKLRGPHSICADGPLVGLFDDTRRKWALGAENLQADILEALGRSAYDTGRHEVVTEVVGIVARQTDETVSSGDLHSSVMLQIPVTLVGAPKTGKLRVLQQSLQGSCKHDPLTLPFVKLRLDSLQATAQLETALELCQAWLRILGVDDTAITAAAAIHIEHLPRVGHSAPNDGEFKRNLEESALRPQVERIQATLKDARDRAAAADMLYRTGEILASFADMPADWQQQLPAFARAYAVYWVADGVRTGKPDDDDSVRWQRVSARSMRYFVRTSQKIARILASDGFNDTARNCALEFYSHARRVMDVYARHLHRLPRERLAMLLLMASSTRVWGEMEREWGAPGEGLAHLEASLEYVEQAEELLVELGLPDALSYRFFLERFKTEKRLALSKTPNAAIFRRLANRDVDTLNSLAKSNDFWTRLAKRQTM